MVAPVGPDDHTCGDGDDLVVYVDLCCPHCAAMWPRIRGLPARIVFRHFPVVAKHPRSPALHAAAEAAGGQGAFFEMVDELFADHARVDDPHIWARVERLGLDLQRFESDRRSEAVGTRVQRDVESGLRAGVADTLALFRDGREVELATLEKAA